ncbi:hypothetical protein AAHE18_01G127000 [Arachis hypogaea]
MMIWREVLRHDRLLPLTLAMTAASSLEIYCSLFSKSSIRLLNIPFQIQEINPASYSYSSSYSFPPLHHQQQQWHQHFPLSSSHLLQLPYSPHPFFSALSSSLKPQTK